MVLRATDGTDAARSALEELCSTYWYPLYAFVRRNGHQHHDAVDLTQGFFAHLLDGGGLETVDPNKGRFRSFLLASIRNFMRNDWRKQQTRKRGGHANFTSIDDAATLQRFQQELSHADTAEDQFERDWVASLLHQVIFRLRGDYEAAGRLDVFDALHAWLVADTDNMPLREIAEQLSMTVSAVKMSVHRMKRRYAELLRSEVASTVSAEEDVDDELIRLIANAG